MQITFLCNDRRLVETMYITKTFIVFGICVAALEKSESIFASFFLKFKGNRRYYIHLQLSTLYVNLSSLLTKRRDMEEP